MSGPGCASPGRAGRPPLYGRLRRATEPRAAGLGLAVTIGWRGRRVQRRFGLRGTRRPFPALVDQAITGRDMSEPAAFFFDFWLSYAADRTPGRHASVQMKPEPVRLDLDHDVETLAGNENLAATELHRAEARFLEWAGEAYPDHDLGGWQVRLGAPDGPVLSDFWCGLMANE